MKSKLRKEFEDFKVKTSKKLWLIEHPSKFKFGQKLYYEDEECYNEGCDSIKIKCICKGEVCVEDVSGWQDGSWFVRKYRIEYDKSISKVPEYSLSKRKK